MNHIFTSPVIRGRGKGRSIGFPTINCIVPRKFSLSPGVYAAVVVLMDGRKFRGALHYGLPKTFEQLEPTLEIHLLDFDEDIYDTLVTVTVYDRIRDIRKFESVEELREAITEDTEKVRACNLHV